MNTKTIFRGLLSGFLAGVLFLLLPTPALAKETGHYQPYFGLLHAHTSLSGGEGTPEGAFSQAAGVDGLDFFALTDHSHSFDNDLSASIGTDASAVSEHWAAGKAAAAAVTDDGFVGIYGYEMAFRDSDGFGHISTFHTPGFLSRNLEGFNTLTAYYDALTTLPGAVSQFNHPGPDLGEFQNFGHRTEGYDEALSLLEVGGPDGIGDCSFYRNALDQGWHVGPTVSQNNYHGSFGTQSDVRTVLLADALTEEGLYDAMKNRRSYATEDCDLEISYSLNGAVMGSIIPWQETLLLEISLRDATDGPEAGVEIVTASGSGISLDITSEEPAVLSLPGISGYYYLKLTQPDGDIAVTAPVWVEARTEPEPTEPSELEESTPEESIPGESTPDTYPSMEDLDIRFYFGLLHGHTGLSDGKGTAEEAYAAAAEQMDFYAVTDHSNSFDNDLSATLTEDAALVSEGWARGKAAAEKATTAAFLGLYGFEMTWPDDRNLGHIITFRTPGFLSRNREGLEELENYYEALTAVPGSVSQFCHPGPDLGEFENFTGHSAKYDQALTLLEIGGERGFDAYGSYITALDAGWHVSPTASHNDHEGNFGSFSDSRTVILSRELTEDALLDAMQQRRTYATQDRDLLLYYTLDGQQMGSILPAGEHHTLRLLLSDPTDSGTAQVAVITDGGETLLSCPMSPGGELNLTLPGGKHYYFLRVTQADGDIAVTAPVWTELYENFGIASFTSDTPVPLPGQDVTLELTVFNEEALPFPLTSLKLFADGEPVCSLDAPGTLAPGERRIFSIPYTRETAGAVTLTAEVTAAAEGNTKKVTAELTLHYRPKEMVKGILVDLGHSRHSAGDFDNLEILAEAANMTLRCFTGSLPDAGSILILPPPETAYTAEFLQQVKIFCAQGGTLVVCGCSAEDGPHAAEYQNQLLRTIGCTMSLRADTALDEVSNGGSPEELYPASFNDDALLCENISPEQYYAHLDGATVDPGQGTWLVKGSKTTQSSLTGTWEPVLLAWEELAPSARVLICGSFFLTDEAMPLPKNFWAHPTANQTILETLLGFTREKLPITPIAQVRRGRQNTLYHIKGYTTSGTVNAYNTFPDTIYLQDGTGGIPICPFLPSGISVGEPMVVAGYLEEWEGNPVFRPVDYDLPEEPAYRYIPEIKNNSLLLDYETYGGQLVQAEAKVTSVTLTEDSLGVHRFTLTDAWGDSITVMIEDTIFSGANGTNTLASEVKIGRIVRAMGLLHLDSNGIPVLRVRNCEEVVWVPPFPRPGSTARLTNPYTGDSIGFWSTVLALSLAGMSAAGRRKSRQSRK